MKRTLNSSMPRLRSCVELLLGDLLVALEDDLAGLLVDHVVAETLVRPPPASIGSDFDLRRLELLDRALA